MTTEKLTGRRHTTRVALAVAGTCLVLAACSTDPEATPTNPDGVSISEVRLPDGRTVVCAVWAGYKSGGLTCDWDHAYPAVSE